MGRQASLGADSELEMTRGILSGTGRLELNWWHARAMQLTAIAAELADENRRQWAWNRVRPLHATHARDARGIEELVPCGCLAELVASYRTGAESFPMQPLGDDEGPSVPTFSEPVTDAHVHVFPDPVFAALWRWFEAYGWPIRYQLRTPELLAFLFSRGVERAVALHYAHKPSMSRGLNEYMAAVVARDPRVIGLGTVLPGEPNAAEIVTGMRQRGLRGVKLHCHVQAFAPDSAAAFEVFAACESAQLPVVLHAGRAPRSPAYPVDSHSLCAAWRVERVLTAFPKLKLCVPHFGADEALAYVELLERHDHLYLDSTMMLSGFFGGEYLQVLNRARPERVMYGSDFPNLPYAWDRELRAIAAAELSAERKAQLTTKVANEFFGLEGLPG
jgi:predicted TIM-barrel fold metal-dependent hydrolase